MTTACYHIQYAHLSGYLTHNPGKHRKSSDSDLPHYTYILLILSNFFNELPNANALGTNVQTIYFISYISGGPKKVAQLLVGHNFKTARKNSTKLHTTFFQHVFNHLVKFQSKWTTNVEMTDALKFGVQKSNIINTSNIGCVWHALCTVCC